MGRGEECDTGPDRPGVAAGSKPFIVPIPGTRNIDHLNENLGALDVDLTAAEVQQISTESAALTVHGERMDAANMALVE